MYVTFIIGNGFDLNLGLPTSYGHFYKYYLKNKSSDTKVVVDLKNNIKQYKDRDWKDLELGLGVYTQEVEKIDQFQEAYLDIQQNITSYIRKIEELLEDPVYQKDELVQSVVKGFREPESYLSESLNANIKTFRRNVQDTSEARINIITFNYTHTVEKFLEEHSSIGTTVGKPVIMEKIFHVHREIQENGVWLGVDNVSQIANEKFRDDAIAKILLVKPETIAASGSLVVQNCQSVIDRTDLFVVFGSSLGETDLSWWNRIGERLKSVNTRLIFFEKNNETYVSDQLMFLEELKIRERLKGIFKLDDSDMRPNEQNKLCVAINSKIFKDKEYAEEMSENFQSVMERNESKNMKTL